MDIDSDSSSSSTGNNDEELEKFKQEELKRKIDALESKVNLIKLKLDNRPVVVFPIGTNSTTYILNKIYLVNIIT